MRVALAALAMLLGSAVFEARAATQSLKMRLVPSGAEPRARGKVLMSLREGANGLDAKLEIVVRRLDRRATFEVVLQGVRIGTIATRGNGNGRARFRNRPHHRDQRLGPAPRGGVPPLGKPSGTDILATLLPGRSSDPDHVQCCVAGGSRCASLTGEECAAGGGVDRGAGSCLPDPCASPASSPPVTCCVPDTDGPTCEIDAEPDCAASSGIVVDGGTCTPDPC